MKEWFAKKTLKIRHFVASIIIPYIWDHYSPEVKNRGMMMFIKSMTTHPYPLTGVEIGVGNGDNAKNMLDMLPMHRFYLVDPFTSYYDTCEGKKVLLPIYDFKKVKEKLSCYKNVIFIKKASETVVKDIPDDLDFVYIDGNHSYECVKKDIESYYPKVKDGGVIGGHDFSTLFLGVPKAVIEFANENNLSIQGKGLDWWIVKE